MFAIERREDLATERDSASCGDCGKFFPAAEAAPARVAQWIRAPVFGTGCRGFESLRERPPFQTNPPSDGVARTEITAPGSLSQSHKHPVKIPCCSSNGTPWLVAAAVVAEKVQERIGRLAKEGDGPRKQEPRHV